MYSVQAFIKKFPSKKLKPFFLTDSEKLGSQFRLPYVTFVIIIFSDSYKVNLIKNLPH